MSITPSNTSNLDDRIEACLQDMSLEEKVAMLAGRGKYLSHTRSETWGGSPYPAGSGCSRLDIPPLMFADGPRGVIVGRATCFPVSMARGASFDRGLERRIGEAMGKEARALGCTLLGSVCVNVLRHPAWGRAQETYGEDPFLLGEMGKELTLGIQAHNVMATVKHFALNSMENARFKVDVLVDDRALYEVYLPHFRKIIEAGCSTVMSAYNKMNGEYCGENSRLLTDILRDEWGFTGFVHSDWVLGVYSPEGVVAGLDIENPEPAWFGKPLMKAIEAGDIAPSIIDKSVRRILKTQLSTIERDDPLDSYPLSLVACAKHRILAREAAEKSAVLLENKDCLPLCADMVEKLAVFGVLSQLENTGDQGSSRVNSPYVITPLQGLQAFLGPERAYFAGDEMALDTVQASAQDADAAVVVVGYTAADEGEFIPDNLDLGQAELPESLAAILTQNDSRRDGLSVGGDRASLRLKPDQVALIRAVAEVNPKTIVVVMAGSAVLMDEWSGSVGAILQTFYAGMEGGTALANLLFGVKSPSGKLPFSVAEREEDYPPFDINAEAIKYDYWHGYSHLDRTRRKARYPFGFGLSYTSFVYGEATVFWLDESILRVSISVQNAGNVDAAEVTQLYVSAPSKQAERHRKALRGFERIELLAGCDRILNFDLTARDLAYYDPDDKLWKVEEGIHHILVGGSSDDAETHRFPIYVKGQTVDR